MEAEAAPAAGHAGEDTLAAVPIALPKIPSKTAGNAPKAETAANPNEAATVSTAGTDAASGQDQATQATVAGTPAHASATTVAPKAEAQADGAKKAAATDDLTPPVAQPPTVHEHRIVASAGSTPADGLSSASIAAAPSPSAHMPATVAPVAQLTATVATAAPVPLNGLAVELATRAQNGTSRFDIRLDPAELGRIDVRIDIDRDGNVKSHLTVEKPETLAMLRQDSPQLQRALNEAGLKTADGGMQFTLGDQSQPRQNTDSGERQAQRFIIRDDETTATTPAPIRNYGRMAAARSGVDISV